MQSPLKNDAERPRVLMVKEHVDVFGPRRPVRFAEVTPRALLDLFAFKPTYWETTTVLRGDWAIVQAETQSGQRSYVESLAHLAPVIEQQRATAVCLRELDLSSYDIVISFEACLSPLDHASGRPNRFYFHHEHANDWYRRARGAPARGYAGFLDHMGGRGGAFGENYPGLIDFPYLRDPQTVRAAFPRTSDSTGPVVWIDARTIMQQAKSSTLGTWTEDCDEYLRRLELESGVRVSTRAEIYRSYYNLSPGGDAVAYLAAMSCADFYIGLAGAGAGQALCDGASLGLVCFGSPRLPYHRMICPPERQCHSLSSALAGAVELYASPAKMTAARREQDAILLREFQYEPVKRLFDRAGIGSCVAGS